MDDKERDDCGITLMYEVEATRAANARAEAAEVEAERLRGENEALRGELAEAIQIAIVRGESMGYEDKDWIARWEELSGETWQDDD